MLNKKLYWGTASVIAFAAIAALSGGASLINYPTGDDLGLSLALLANSPFKDYTLPGQILTYWFGIGGLATLSFSFKRFKTFTICVFAYGTSLVVWLVAQVFYTKEVSLLLFIFGLVAMALLIMAYAIMQQLKKLNQW